MMYTNALMASGGGRDGLEITTRQKTQKKTQRRERKRTKIKLK